MKTTDALPADYMERVSDLNLMYLMLSRDVLRNEQAEGGEATVVRMLLGLDNSVADWLLSATDLQIARFAQTPALLFSCKLSVSALAGLSTNSEKTQRWVAMARLVESVSPGDLPSGSGINR